MVSTLKEKTANGLFWGGISNGVQQIIGGIFGIIIARILLPDDYGLVGMLAIFSAIATTFVDSGFIIALTNKSEIKEEDYNAVFWFSLLTGLLIYILLFFSAPYIADFYGNPLLKNLSRVLFLNFVIASFGTAHYALLFKKIMVKERAKIDILSIIVSGIVGLFFALNGYTYWSIVFQMLSYSIAITLSRIYISPFKPSLNIVFSPLREMFSFSYKLLLTNILLQINANLFSVLFGKLYGEKQVGYYSQGVKWFFMANTTISGMINSVSQPVLVEVKEEKERQVAVFRKMIRLGAFISFPCMFGMIFIAREFILITVGAKWLESVPFLQLFSIWGAFSFLTSLYTNILLVYGKSNIYMLGAFFVCALQLISVLSMSPIGIFPMVYAYLASSFVSLFFFHYFVNRLIGLRIWHVICDISPYFAISIFSLAISFFVLSTIESIYILFVSKILVMAFMYIAAMKMSNSVIFNESVGYIIKMIKK